MSSLTNTVTPPAQRPAMSSRLELAVKFGALFVGFIYALGFIIIAIHHAQFSIPQFDPLKPKIFSTGLVFLLMVGAPAIAAFRAQGLLGLRTTTGVVIPSQPQNRDWLTLAILRDSFSPAMVLGDTSPAPSTALVTISSHGA